MPHTAVARSYGGPGIPIVEIQMSSWPSSTGRGRVTTAGIPRAVLDQVAGIVFGVSFAGCDRMVSARLVNTDKFARRYGLALAVAASAVLARQRVPSEFIFLGELDLARRVRDVPMRVLENLLRSICEREIETPITIVAPPASAELIEGTEGVEVVGAATWAEVVVAVWPHLRKG
ncbi:MAG TPA: hypothetical protein VK986_14335 [Tepidisphaeraceae bacterium]|nr:hypothetical protein [Tepidisphaeraceae bacterium]